MRPFLLVMLCSALASSNCIAAESLKVVSVSSGNLLSVQDQTGEIQQVSLYGIDAPDNEQKMGQQAHKMLSAMVGDKDVEVKVDGTDPKGVPSVHLVLNGLSINAAMVKSCYAWVNPASCKSSNCSTWTDYQQYASKNKKGLWVDSEAEPPWMWRERRKKAEALVKKVNEDSEYVSYYGSLANSGYRSLSKRSPSGNTLLSGLDSPGNTQGSGSYAGSSGAGKSKSGTPSKTRSSRSG